MSLQKQYPRVLLVASGKINSSDTSNNGLLLRNLFGKDWPRVHIAQIYSTGDNGDPGFFGQYYKLGPSDRRLGKLFFRLKSESSSLYDKPHQAQSASAGLMYRLKSRIRSLANRYIIDSGVYELVFRPKISGEMHSWIREFNPDVILAQGYTLSFTLLPLFIKQFTNARLAVFPTDDWPKYQYAGMHGEPSLFRPIMKAVITKSAARLFAHADIPLAFGDPMTAEYTRRYNKVFLNVNHADDPMRFENCTAVRVNEPATFTIAAIGTFNEFRWPLLLDANEACRALKTDGLNVRLSVFTSFMPEQARTELANASFIDIYPDPGNDHLPSYLKGADALLLLEGFDQGFVSAIKLSISSKAHLFMFSQRPIIVYAAAETGIAQYALDYGWATVVSHRSITELAKALKNTLCDSGLANELVLKANMVAHERHTHQVNQSIFRNALLRRS